MKDNEEIVAVAWRWTNRLKDGFMLAAPVHGVYKASVIPPKEFNWRKDHMYFDEYLSDHRNCARALAWVREKVSRICATKVFSKEGDIEHLLAVSADRFERKAWTDPIGAMEYLDEIVLEAEELDE